MIDRGERLPMTMVVTDEQLDEYVEKEISQIAKAFIGGDPLAVSAQLYKPKLDALTTYISYRVQKEKARLTKTLIRWSKILAISTIVLASATVVLALVSYFR